MVDVDVLEHSDVMAIAINEESLSDAHDAIAHFGTEGMKWYRRRYQNEDGSLTPAGREHYGVGPARADGANPASPSSATATQVTATATQKKPGFFERKRQEKAAAEAAQKKRAQQQAALEKARQTKAANEAKKKAEAEQEKQRQADLNSGDYAKIQKWVDKSTADELNAALNKANIAAQINQKAAPEIEAARKEAVQAAMRSGDMNQVRKYAADVNVSDNDLRSAVNKVNIMQQMNAVQPKKTVADHIDNACNNLNRAMNWYDTGTKVWNRIAAANNAFNRTGNDLPLIGQNNSGLLTAAQKAARAQEQQRSEAVNRAIRSGNVDKIEKAMPFMTSNELNAAYSYLNNKETLRQTINRQKSSAAEKAAQDEVDKILRSGRADEILNNQSKFSNNDLNNARDRTNSINALQRNAMAQRARSMQAAGKTYKEIAQALNIPDGSVGTLILGGK